MSGRVDADQQVVVFRADRRLVRPAAVLICEITRRPGRGWPTILLSALGFTLVEEGLLPQSLFPPHYLGLDLISYGRVGWLGTALLWAIFVLSIHVVWKIVNPLAPSRSCPARSARSGVLVVIALAVGRRRPQLDQNSRSSALSMPRSVS